MLYYLIPIIILMVPVQSGDWTIYDYAVYGQTLDIKLTSTKEKVGMHSYSIVDNEGNIYGKYQELDGVRLALRFTNSDWPVEKLWLADNTGYKEPLFNKLLRLEQRIPDRDNGTLKDNKGPGKGSGSGEGKPSKEPPEASKCECCGCDKSKCSCENDCKCKGEGCAKSTKSEPSKAPSPKPGQDKGSGSGLGKGPGPDGDCDNELPKQNPMPVQPPESDKAKKGNINDNFILYIASTEENGKGIVYQVDSNGAILGKVSLSYPATSLALHRNKSLVVTIPREGGQIVEITDSGKVNSLIYHDKLIPHPVRVAIKNDSDSMIIVDDVAKKLMAGIVMEGGITKTYQNLTDKVDSPSIAITDMGLMYRDGEQVASDTTSEKWAMTKTPNKIVIREGESIVKTITLPPGKSLYKNGLMSFTGVGPVCVACRDSTSDDIWIIAYDVTSDKTRSLFKVNTPLKNAEMNSFVVGPRMLWEQKSPQKSTARY